MSDAYRPGTQRQHGWNLYHLNALFDLENGIYTDVLVQKEHTKSEDAALCEMAGRSAGSEPVILLADRSYEAYNNFAHLEQAGWKYLIRLKDRNRTHAYGITLPDQPEFDLPVRITFFLMRFISAAKLCGAAFLTCYPSWNENSCPADQTATSLVPSLPKTAIPQPRQIPLAKIHDLPGVFIGKQPDKNYGGLVTSIQAGGVKEPVVLRLREDGEYQLVTGYRRRRASEPAIEVRTPNSDKSVTLMVCGCSS